LEALSAMYVPRWRIGFLVPPAEHAADRAALISEFAENQDERAVASHHDVQSNPSINKIAGMRV